MSVKSRNDW